MNELPQTSPRTRGTRSIDSQVAFTTQTSGIVGEESNTELEDFRHARAQRGSVCPCQAADAKHTSLLLDDVQRPWLFPQLLKIC